MRPDASETSGVVPGGAPAVLAESPRRGAATAVRRGAEPAGEGDLQRGRAGDGRLRYAGVVLRLRIHAASRAREPGRCGLDPLPGALGRHARPGRVPPCGVGMGHDRGGEASGPRAALGGPPPGYPEYDPYRECLRGRPMAGRPGTPADDPDRFTARERNGTGPEGGAGAAVGLV